MRDGPRCSQAGSHARTIANDRLPVPGRVRRSRRTGPTAAARGSFAALVFACVSAAAVADVADNNEGDTIAFFAPFDGRYPAFREAFFSVPRPLVQLDPVVFGNPDQYPNHTTIQQVGPDSIRVRLRGTVFDFLADAVADRHADIEQVRIASQLRGAIATAPVVRADLAPTHPFGDEFDSAPLAEAVRPYAFAGRFDYGEFELTIGTGSNGINVQATNLAGKTATATLNIRAAVNREEGRYELTADTADAVDPELYNPILVYISDPEVTPRNIGNRYALINGHRVGLRFIDSQLQLDRPIIGISRTPDNPVPNIVNVTGKPRNFLIRYGEQEATFYWSYTQ